MEGGNTLLLLLLLLLLLVVVVAVGMRVLLPLLSTATTTTAAGTAGPLPPLGVASQPVADLGGLPDLPLQDVELPLHPLDVGPHPLELGALQPQPAGPVLRSPDRLAMVGPDLVQGRGQGPLPAPGLGVRRLGLEELLVRLLLLLLLTAALLLALLLSISILLPSGVASVLVFILAIVLVFILIIVVISAFSPTEKEQSLEGSEAILLSCIISAAAAALVAMGRRHEAHLAAGPAELPPPLQEGQPALLGAAAGRLLLPPGPVEVALGGVPRGGPVVVLPQGPAEVAGQPTIALGRGGGGVRDQGRPVGPQVGQGRLEGLQGGALLRDGLARRLDVAVEGGVLLEEGHGPRRRSSSSCGGDEAVGGHGLGLGIESGR